MTVRASPHGRGSGRPTYGHRDTPEGAGPTVEANLNRHLGIAKDWMPHEYVPWSDGRNFALLDGEPWTLGAVHRCHPLARTALEVNLLTEDDLPSYHREVDRAFGRDNAWGFWVNRWTAEEGRHAFCIRDYLLVTRGVDPEGLEQARMETMQVGFDFCMDKPLKHVCAYVSFQELATRVSHRNTGQARGPGGGAVADPCLEGREPPHDLLPEPGRGGAGAGARDQCGRSPTRWSDSRCRGR